MNRIRELAELKNISQKQIILDTGIGQSTVSYYMNQLKDPKGDKLIKLAEYFKVDPLVINCKAPIPKDYVPNVDYIDEYTSGIGPQTEYSHDPISRPTSGLTDEDLQKIANLVSTNPDAPRTPEARIVSFGMDNLPQETRERILAMIRAMFFKTPEEKYFKEGNANDTRL